MLQNERKQYILELINRDRIVRAADLVERLGVSMETIRQIGRASCRERV